MTTPLAFKKPAVAAVAAVDDGLDRIKAQTAACAESEADAQLKIDKLTTDLRAGIESGVDTGEIEAAILSERAALERLALRRVPLERLALEKTAALKAKKHRLRIERLENAETSDREALASLDAEIIEDLLMISPKLSRRLKLVHDLSQTNGRLQHIGGVPRGTGNLTLSEAPLEAAFVARHPEALRQRLDSGKGPTWRPFGLSIPVMTPDYVTAAVTADEEMNAS